jgi:hypothetical protein
MGRWRLSWLRCRGLVWRCKTFDLAAFFESLLNTHPRYLCSDEFLKLLPGVTH